MASLKSFLSVADCYKLGIYMHISLLSKALISEVSAEAVSSLPVSSATHDHFPHLCVVVVTVNDVQGYIKHRGRWTRTV